jgi:hypothetical protein
MHRETKKAQGNQEAQGNCIIKINVDIGLGHLLLPDRKIMYLGYHLLIIL